MKIILDFDDTIFNTHRLFDELIKIFNKVGFTKEEFEENYQKIKQKIGNFDLAVGLDLAYQLRPFDKEKVKREINSLLNKATLFVYQDFTYFARSFNKKDLILLSFGVSFGTPNFQKSKVKKSKVTSFFNKIIITSNKDKFEELKIILKKYPDEKIFFIDDKAELIDRVKKQFPQITTMKIERSQGWHIHQKSQLTDYTIHNLDQAKDIINKLSHPSTSSG